MSIDYETNKLKLQDAKYDKIMPGNIYGEMFQKSFITVELKSKNIEFGYIDIKGNEDFPDK